MKYAIAYHRRVEKQMSRIPKQHAARIQKAILMLSKDPYAGKKLDGDLAGLRSLRVWTYRVLYEVFEDTILIVVLSVGHRQGVYK